MSNPQGQPIASSVKHATIIGDTPNDIACGAHLGVNAIAVATGRYGEEELRRHGPAHLFHDLSDTRSVLDAIESP